MFSVKYKCGYFDSITRLLGLPARDLGSCVCIHSVSHQPATEPSQKALLSRKEAWNDARQSLREKPPQMPSSRVGNNSILHQLARLCGLRYRASCICPRS